MSCDGKFRPFWAKLIHEEGQTLSSFYRAVFISWIVAVECYIWIEPGYTVYWTSWDGLLRTTEVKQLPDDWVNVIFHDLRKKQKSVVPPALALIQARGGLENSRLRTVSLLPKNP